MDDKYLITVPEFGAEQASQVLELMDQVNVSAGNSEKMLMLILSLQKMAKSEQDKQG